jgi:hypothetical protein
LVRRRLVEVLLEAGEEVADFFGAAKVGYGIRERVLILEAEQRG